MVQLIIQLSLFTSDGYNLLPWISGRDKLAPCKTQPHCTKRTEYFKNLMFDILKD